MRPNCQKMECLASGEVQHPDYLKTQFADAARCVPTVGCLRFSLTAHPLHAHRLINSRARRHGGLEILGDSFS